MQALVSVALFLLLPDQATDASGLAPYPVRLRRSSKRWSASISRTSMKRSSSRPSGRNEKWRSLPSFAAASSSTMLRSAALRAYALTQSTGGSEEPSAGRHRCPRRSGAARPRPRGARAWARIGPAASEAAPALRRLLTDSDPRVRAGAARAFGSLGQRSVRAPSPQLIDLLRDQSHRSRSSRPSRSNDRSPAAAAAPALRVVASSDADPSVRAAAASALEAIDPTVRGLIER